MCHSLFSHLYETRLLFLTALNDELATLAGNESIPDFSPMTINSLFHECIEKHLSFREVGREYVKGQAKAASVVNT